LEHLIKYITKKKDIRIQPSFIGSLEGLMQLYRGHTDMAAVHLMNADTLEFNLPFIKQLLLDCPSCLCFGVTVCPCFFFSISSIKAERYSS